jgi:prephenate dehydrogenase
MTASHLISRVTILGTGLIGGSFALALRKHTQGIRIIGWDRADIAQQARARSAVHESFTGDLAPALRDADLIYIALPIAATLDLLPEIARHAPLHALVTDACSTKVRVTQAAAELFPGDSGPLFLAGHPMAGRELSGLAHADAELFRGTTYALVREPSAVVAGLQTRSFSSDVEAGLVRSSHPDPVGATRASSPANEPSSSHDPRVSAFLKILEKIGAQPLWLGAQQHDYAVGLVSHLPQLAAVALASFLYDRLDENGLPITLAGPGLRDSLRLAGSPYSTWRDIVLTNREVLSAALDLFARRLDDLRERLASRELESDFDAANELYKLLRSL